MHQIFCIIFMLFFISFNCNAEKLALRWYYTSESITDYATFLKDENKSYTIEQIKSPEVQALFKPFSPEEINQGVNDSSYWFKLDLYNPRDNGVTWVIYPANSYMDSLEVWVKNENSAWQYRKVSDYNNFARRAINYRLINVAFQLRSKHSAEVYIRLSSKHLAINNINLFIAGQKNLRDILAEEYLFYGVYYGLFIALILLIISIWFYAQTHNYRYYFFFLSYLASNIMLWLSINGFSFQFFWPKSPEVHNFSLSIFYLFVTCFAWLFSREVLNTKDVSPKLDKLLIFAICFFATAIGLRLFDIAYDVVFYISIMGMVSLALQPLLAWHCYKKGATYLIIFIIAWLPYTVSIIAYFLVNTFKWGVNVEPYLQVSVLFECLVLIIATLSKMNYRSEKLEQLILQDPLTKLGNRRLLEDHIELISTNKKDLGQYWVLLADIDFFKSINDNYGHSTGDVVLVKLAKLMKKICRADDIAIRWGGEEFLLLVKVENENLAFTVAERIRTRFSEDISIVEGKELRHTISIGIHPLDFTSASPLVNAIEFADEALYQAKETGRNQCIIYREKLAVSDQ